MATRRLNFFDGYTSETTPSVEYPLGVRWLGTWVSGDYINGDLVEYLGTSYICILDTTAAQIPTNTTYWDVFAAGTIALGSAHQVLQVNSAGTAQEYALLDNNNIDAAAAIDASKIADGSVSNAEFQHISTLTSNAQTQLNAKLDDVTVATDNALVRFDTNGQALQNSPVIVDDSGNMSGVANITTSGNIDKASAASLDIGGTNATTINIGRSGQTTVVKGNLQVDGTTTTVNSTTMEVADANVRVNNGGNDASAEGAGLTIEGTSNSDLATIQYAAALASKFKAGASGSESEIITASTAQTMTGVKTFDEELVLKHNATPSTPSSGYVKTYVKSDNKAYILDSSGNEVPLGSSTGAGEVNINTNPNADNGYDLNGSNDVGDWIDSGTGTTVSKTTTSSEIPLYPIRTSGIKIVNDGSGTGYTRLRMILPESLENTKLKIQWNQLYSTSTAYVSGDFKVEMYSYTDSAFSVAETELALSTDSSGTSSIPALNGRFTTTFDTTTANYLELRIVRTAGSANSYIALNDVIIGPGIQPQGAAVSEEQDYTIGGFAGSPPSTTLTTQFAKYYRVGSKLRARVKLAVATFNYAGSVQANNTVFLDRIIPSGLTINSAFLDSSARSGFGKVAAYMSGTAYAMSGYAVGVIERDTNGYRFIVNNKDTGTSGGSGQSIPWGAFGNPTAGSINGFIQFEFEVPIDEWAGSGTVNLAQNDVEYAYNTTTTDASDSTSFGYGPAGSQFGNFTALRTKRVRFQTPIQDTDEISLEIYFNGSWLPHTSSGNVVGIDAFNRQGSNTYGIAAHKVSGTTTDVDVYFGIYASVSNTASYAAAGNAWSAYDVDPSYKWRVKKTAAGIATGFGAATANFRGLVKGGEVPGSTSGTAIAAGYVGQIITSSQTSLTSVGTSNQYFDARSITLTAGTWLITGYIAYTRNGATITDASAVAGLSVTSGNSGVGANVPVNWIDTGSSTYPTTFATVPAALPTMVVRYDGTTLTFPDGSTMTPSGGVVYLKGFAMIYSGGPVQYRATLTATRIA